MYSVINRWVFSEGCWIGKYIFRCCSIVIRVGGFFLNKEFVYFWYNFSYYCFNNNVIVCKWWGIVFVLDSVN